MKKALLSFLLFCSALSAHSQQQPVVGMVLTADGKALAGAHVLDINSRQAVASDQFGKFELSVADSGTVLRISHLGLRPVLYAVPKTTLAAQDSTQPLIRITLSQESIVLSHVLVSSSTHRTVIDGQRGVVLRDFNFADDNNLLLMAEDGIRYLLLCNENWQEQARIRIDKKGDRLYQDCLGNTHLFGGDSVYQIAITDNIISFVSVSEHGYFLEQMAHCATATDNHIFFSSYQKAGQEVYHYGLHRSTKEGIILQHVYNHQGLQDIEDYFAELPNQRRAQTRFHDAGMSYANQRLEAMQTASCLAYQGAHAGLSLKDNCLDPLSIYRYRTGIQPFYARNHSVRHSGIESNAFGTSETQYFQSVSNRNLEQQ